MKRNTIITMAVILAVAGAISYLIIWLRNRASAPVTETDTTKTDSSTINTGATGSGYALPKINTYAWWIDRIGHAKFPLGMASKGVEVLKVQEVLNAMAVTQKLNVSALKEDGIWGFNTNARFKLLFPAYSGVTQYQYITDFDPTQETLK